MVTIALSNAQKNEILYAIYSKKEYLEKLSNDLEKIDRKDEASKCLKQAHLLETAYEGILCHNSVRFE